MYNNREYRYLNLVNNVSVQVFSGRGILHSVVVNTASVGAITIVDSTSTSASTPAVGTLKSNVAEGTYEYDVAIANGLRIINAGSPDITVVYTTG